MEDYKRQFIEFIVRAGALRFGEFVTKSGRQTPYFINTGLFDDGAKIEQLGSFYARAIRERLGDGFDNLFGPAYKGIPLVVTTAVALRRDYDMNVTYTFNRKEAKDHGEGGLLVGHGYKDGDRIVMVEDVTTAGTSVRETAPMLRAAAKTQLKGLVVSVDRQERGAGGTTALRELAEEFSMTTFAIVTLDEIVEHLSAHDVDGRRVIDGPTLDRIARYRKEYGA